MVALQLLPLVLPQLRISVKLHVIWLCDVQDVDYTEGLDELIRHVAHAPLVEALERRPVALTAIVRIQLYISITIHGSLHAPLVNEDAVRYIRAQFGDLEKIKGVSVLPIVSVTQKAA